MFIYLIETSKRAVSLILTHPVGTFSSHSPASDFPPIDRTQAPRPVSYSEADYEKSKPVEDRHPAELPVDDNEGN